MSLLLMGLQFLYGLARKIPDCIWEVSRKISFLSKKKKRWIISITPQTII